MAGQDPREIVQSYLRGWTTGDFGLLDQILDPEVEYRERGQVHDQGGLYDSVSSFSRVFADSRFTVDLWVVEGDVVACHYTFEGEHTGRLHLDPPLDQALRKEAVAPSGRRVRTSGTLICVLRNGRIRRIIAEFDQLMLLTKLGAFGRIEPDVVEVPDLQPIERWWKD